MNKHNNKQNNRNITNLLMNRMMINQIEVIFQPIDKIKCQIAKILLTNNFYLTINLLIQNNSKIKLSNKNLNKCNNFTLKDTKNWFQVN